MELLMDKFLQEIKLQGKIYHQSPVAKIVQYLINQAVKLNASDIHIEPQEKFVQIRLRIDGKLLIIGKLPIEVASYLNSYLKLQANLNISEKRLPQDGSILNQENIRLSVIPTLHGEKMVLRLLPKRNDLLALNNLNLSRENLATLRKLLSLSGGIIAVTGPVNSGKTTLLYAMLNYLNKENVNIVTIEDPVEVKLNGINQMQVNLPAGLDFSTALRAVLRQDPDIVMIGEIRDDIVAKEAIRAALTGHLVLTTLHTKNALTIPARLLNMGVNPDLLAISFAGGISQRLVRKICPKCKTAYTIKKHSLETLVLGKYAHEGMELFKGTGCAFCHYSGYSGRFALQEIFTTNAEIQRLITSGEVDLKLKRIANLGGMQSLLDDGINKILAGQTTATEIWRVLNGIYLN